MDTEHELQVDAALLGITRRRQAGFELAAATNARLRQAVKRLEAAGDAREAPGAGAWYLPLVK